MEEDQKLETDLLFLRTTYLLLLFISWIVLLLYQGMFYMFYVFHVLYS